MKGHTPGPWHWQKSERYDRLYAKDNVHAVRILVADKTSGNNLLPLKPADSRLIAAAPELLEALHNCVNLLREVYGMLDPEKIGNETLEDWLKDAKAAIARAQGTP